MCQEVTERQLRNCIFDITDFIQPLAERREYRLSNYKNIAKAKAIEKQNRERLLKVNPKLNDRSGIYFLLREDEKVPTIYRHRQHTF